VENPLDGIVPDFSIFGAEFTAIWQKLAAGLWGVAILVAVGYLGHGILGIAQNRGGHPGNLRESRKEALNAGIALGGLLALAVIVSVFIAIFGQ
jgi:type IV secretion system pilin